MDEPGSFPTIQTDFSGPGVSLVARLSSTFSPTLLNEFVASYTTDHITLNNAGQLAAALNFPDGRFFPGNGDGILPGINLAGGNAYGGGFGEDAGYIPNGLYNSNPTYTYRDNVSKIIGKHNLQFGAYFAAAQKNELGGELGAGSIPGYLTFDSSNTGISAAIRSPICCWETSPSSGSKIRNSNTTTAIRFLNRTSRTTGVSPAADFESGSPD